MWLFTVLACSGPSTEDGSETPPPAATGDTQSVDTARPDTGDTAPAFDPCAGPCDDGFDCTRDTCDGDGRCIHESLGVCEWPASSPTDALSLSDLDPGGGLQLSVSGVGYDRVTGAMWIVRNAGPEGVWRLVPDGQGSWIIDDDDQGDPAVWIGLAPTPDDDFEGIAVVDGSPPNVVYLIEEDGAQIVSMTLARAGVSDTEGQWDVSPWVPRVGALGPEGLAFVPDAVLADQGFVDGDGQPRQSAGGLGGLMFVAHQSGGFVHAFDLHLDGTVDHVGAYETDHTDSSGLGLDPVTGRLYVWHGNVNQLEIVRLTSTEGDLEGQRRFDSEYVFDLLSLGNVEGIELVGDCADGERPLAVVTDDGGTRSVLVYTDWPMGC